jgi:peptide chain release factor 1
MPRIDLDIKSLLSEKNNIDSFLSSPDAYAQDDYTDKVKRLNELDILIRKMQEKNDLNEQLSQAHEIVNKNEDSELVDLAKSEITDIEKSISKIDDNLFEILAPKDENDEKNVIIEIRAGAGGDEASLFAADLYRMYLRYCENHRLKTELISENMNSSNGYKEVIFKVSGDKQN